MTFLRNATTGEAEAATASPATSHAGAPGEANRYRADIDGLRAIAVGAVLIYHTGISPLRGGFIGVDIFLVISGYLITGLLLNDLKRGRFSLKTFYERRIRRILPAMLAMIAVILAVAPFLLYPPELRVTMLTAVASLASAANLYLLTTAGYFEADAATQPLLHMWSLGVEEQFYLFFPLFILACSKRPGLLRWGIAGLAAASFAACVAWSFMQREAAYYLPLTRAWELLAGALLVVFPLPRLPRWLREAGALAALGLMAVALFKIHSGMAFPGYVALAPCLAAAALIAIGGNGGSLVSRLLAVRPMVFVGKISYSLYLWHWPVFVTFRLVCGRQPSFTEAVALAATAIALAWLFLRYVESPFREKRLFANRKAIFLGAAAASGGLALAGVALFALALPAAQPRDEADRLSRYLVYDDKPVYRRETCFLIGHRDAPGDYDPARCLTPATDRPNVLVVGDSHAAHLWSGLNDRLAGTNVMQATATGCKPVIGTKGETTCKALISTAFNTFIPQQHVDLLVLSARWEEGDIDNLRRTVQTLRPQVGALLVSGPIAEYGVALPRLLARIADGGPPSLLVTARHPETARTDADVGRAVTEAGGRYFSPYRFLCAGGDGAPCKTVSGGVPLQWDYGHLTHEGSDAVAAAMAEAGVLALTKP